MNLSIRPSGSASSASGSQSTPLPPENPLRAIQLAREWVDTDRDFEIEGLDDADRDEEAQESDLVR